MRRRKSGNWQIEIRDQRLRGGRMAISARTQSKPEARKREGAVRTLMDRGDLDVIERLRQGEVHIAEIERAVRDGDFERLKREAGDRLTLGELLDRVVTEVEATRAQGTLKQYEVLARQLKREWGGDTDPASITRAQVARFLHRPRDGSPWSARKQALTVALAGKVWAHGIEREAEAAERTGTRPLLTRNPWREVETPEVRRTRFAWLRPSEWRALSKAVAGRPVHAALALGCLAGLRLSEVIHLRTGVDVDMEERRIRVQSRDGEYPWQPKTGRSERDLKVSPELYGILSEHIALGFAGDRYLIRTDLADRPISPSTLARWTEDAFGKAGIEYGRDGDALTFHSLRHSFASWLVQRDVQLKKVAMLLGNTSQMVDRVYSHLLPSDLDSAVDLVGKIARSSTESSSGNEGAS